MNTRHERASEATGLVRDLIDGGWTVSQIANETWTSERNVYRWLREGRAPHPVMLDKLRGMAQKGKPNVHSAG